MTRSSPRLRATGLRRLSALLATAVAATGITFFVAPASAWALGPGKMCLYLAPSGAQAGPIGPRTCRLGNPGTWPGVLGWRDGAGHR